MATSTTTSSVEDWLQQFYKENANNLSQQYDIAKNIYNANNTYQPYTGQRIQGFTPDQLQGMQMVRDNIGAGQQALQGAVARAGQAAKSWTDTGGANFAPNAVLTENYNQSLGANVLDPALASADIIGDRAPQIGALDAIRGGSYRADQLGAERITAPQAIQAGGYRADQVNAGGGYRADQVQAQNIHQMQQLANREFDRAAADQYMNPYTQTALRSTLDEMGRQNQIGQLADQGRAAKAGAFGGSRQAVVQAERDRNFGKAVADTTAKAYDQAYGQAQQQFNTDIQRGLQTGQFNVGTELSRQQQNQQAALQAGQANQAANATAAQFGLGQNLQAQQANQAANAQAAQFGLGQNFQAQQQNIANLMAQQQGNQQAALQAGQANQAANAQAAQFGLGQNLTAQQLNNANELARRQANQQTGLQSLQLDQASRNQMALANQTARNNMALANEDARQRVFGINRDTFNQNQDRSLATQTQNQNMGLQAFNANRDQFNTDQQRQLASGQLAGQLAPMMQNMSMQDANNILSIGGMQQGLGQQNLTLGYQDFLNQKAQPYENFAFLQSALQGQNYNPYQGMLTQTTNASDPSKLGQAAGLATTALGVVGATGGFGSDGWLKSMWS